ncbi:dethiobiotin synthase [Alteromonas sp. 5E99-2]|uniref:dethiobiotin synthase n=1 Tax=Alteromonas sp. 5E99-2 TaxID=2817683 RepID=UPI001A98D233|nr:dethiobiotin synthase [Alteromonas sp. 5E99-2]MBO1256188.1 dethiobiotin synthase [Alteromonas sp. 5E99-2]
MQKWFITGTDTDVGKTYVGQQIMLGLAEQSLRSIGYKPISAGCQWNEGQWINDDAKQYQVNSTIKAPIEQINPIAFEAPIAPHIAAKQQGKTITFAQLDAGLAQLEEHQPEVIVTEGAGGWRLPLGNGEYLSSFPAQHKMKVILVVGLKLGCLNHAVLTAESIKADGAELVGWIGNEIHSDMLFSQENIESLNEILGPALAIVPKTTALTKVQRAQLIHRLFNS